MSVFDDQAKFMMACGQTVEEENPAQFFLYLKLINEEFHELTQAAEYGNEIEIFDALLDIIVVCIGAGHSLGFPMQAGWDEVVRSNMAKVDPVTGTVRRREDGKVIKPDGWIPPALDKLI